MSNPYDNLRSSNYQYKSCDSGKEYLYNQYDAQRQIAESNKEKYKKFKERIEPFSTLSTLDEAKALAAKILPVAKEVNRFNVGGAKCIIINREDCFRISIDSPEEFISYDFV